MKRVALAVVAASLSLASTASAKNECVETSDITGDKVCGRYGDRWSTERTFPIVVGVGLWSGHVEPVGRTWSGSIGTDHPSRFGIAGSAIGMRAMTDVGFDFRLHAFASRSIYLGVDWAFAMGAAQTTIAPTAGWELRDRPTLDWVHARLATVVGGRIPLGRLSLRVETLVGVQVVALKVEGRKDGAEWTQGSLTSFALLLEPRVAVDLWTSPWATVSAWGGQSFVHPAERSMGVSFALHGRAFDGKLTL
ncbi:MAG: hypothetical protein HYV09_21540 [Deltaproteobacteria bacterium]|nr:hypothetical protein [Deltaproteobacteria bacterium]